MYHNETSECMASYQSHQPTKPRVGPMGSSITTAKVHFLTSYSSIQLRSVPLDVSGARTVIK